ncbi:MAG TPA: SCO family protein [Cyclobacteriaceae bacterium]|nr:SCO family protein [Cyclobacteriaceae bacterium]
MPKYGKHSHWSLFSDIQAAIAVFIFIASCAGNHSSKKLETFGPKQVSPRFDNGKTVYDTVYHKIADFRFYDQDSAEITNQTFSGKIYIADFFFTSCPTICPRMNTQLLRVYEKFRDNPHIAILSHSIDPYNDSISVLKDFADKLGVSSDQWHFVAGDQDKIFEIGQKSYMVTAMNDLSEPGGFLHSGALIMVDPERRIRGIYDGTKPEEVDHLINDIPNLLTEYGMQ